MDLLCLTCSDKVRTAVALLLNRLIVSDSYCDCGDSKLGRDVAKLVIERMKNGTDMASKEGAALAFCALVPTWAAAAIKRATKVTVSKSIASSLSRVFD